MRWPRLPRWLYHLCIFLCGIIITVFLLKKTRRPVRSSALRYVGAGNPVVVDEKAGDATVEEQFYNFLRYVSYPCRDMSRLGNKDQYMPRTNDELGWEVCLDTAFRPQKPCLVYSFGLPDISNWKFEDEIESVFECTIHTFDPGFPNLDDHNRTHLIIFHKLGIGEKNQRDDTFGWQLKTLSSIKEILGHSTEIIDILKLDIDGMEGPVISNIIETGEIKKIKQIALRLTFKLNRLEYINTYKILQSLEKTGFRKFYISFGSCLTSSVYTKKRVPRCLELYFINTNHVH